MNKLFADIQQQLLLRPTGDLTVGNSVNFLGRNTSNKGDYNEISLATAYATELLKEADMLNCIASPAPGTKTTSTDVEQPLTTEEHKAYRRAVGKLQWMTHTRPDSAMQQRNWQDPRHSQQHLTSRSSSTYSGTSRERNTTGCTRDQLSEQ